ncbi:SufS family cysteine desulfurase [Pendulispora rubella]|uniref:Cysteine desulfurase n=1 Tax=Pendulispora rubella TaxID=2741070 RepID=A0ABZ2L086_9BACT
MHTVILAAGGSSRLGHPKQLVQIGAEGVSLLRRAVQMARASEAASVTVVLGAHEAAMAAELAGLDVRTVHNAAWQRGMGSSIRCGVHALRGAPVEDGVLFVVCDQLRVTTAHVNRMIAAFREGAAIVASGYADTAGVPALFAGSFREELAGLEDQQGGKHVLERHAARVRVVPLVGGEVDVDTAEDLRRARSFAVGRDFPALEQQVNEKPLVYLDTAATALKPRAVIDAVTQVYARDCANVHRGLHQLSQRASAAYEGARAALGSFLGARSPEEVVFVRGATEALNLVAASWAFPRLGPGDRILVTALEHHANLVPWQVVARRTGAFLDVAPIEPSGDVSLEAFASRLTARTRVVAVSHASNVLGTVLPIRDMARLAHAQGAVLVVDGAQAAPHVRIDVKELDCDFYAVSGHKLYGPSGIGVLWGRAALLADMEPYQVGGDMVAEVAFDGASYRPPPHRFEAGTPNIEGAIGLGAAVRYLRGLDAAAREAHERDLLEYAVSTLEQIPGLEIAGSPSTRIPLLAFAIEDVHPHDLATFLDGEGIAVRAGHHCAQPLLEQLGHTALTRVSFGIYNTHRDIDALAEALRGARDFFSVF